MALRFSRNCFLPIASCGLLLCATDAWADKLSLSVDGVDGELRAAVLAALDLSQYTAGEVSAAQARRLYSHAAEQASKALEPYGYYDTRVDGELTQSSDAWNAVVHVHPGEPVVVAAANLVLEGPARELKAVRTALRAFAPKVGEPMNHAQYERGKTAIQAALFASGFLDAKLPTHKVTLTRSTRKATIDLVWEPGPRYRIGATKFEGAQFPAEFLTRYVPWQEGDYYTQELLLGLQQKLTDADYFALVDVNPDIEHAQDGVVPITVKLAPAKRSIYTAGLFVGTDTGFGVRGGLERRWLNRRGHKLKTEIILAERLKTVSALYQIPLPGPDSRSFNYGVNFRDENSESVQARTASAVANETRQWMGFTRTLGVHLQTGDFTFGDKDRGTIKGNSTVLYPEIGLTRKRADDPLFVRDGYSLNLLGRAAKGGLLADTDFVQVRADAKWIHGIGQRQRLILRGSLGAIWANDFDALPPDLRFFAGGDRTIRGYGFQSIGPQRVLIDGEDPVVFGGKDLAIASAEYEYYFRRNWGVAAFVDAGDAFSGSDYSVKVGTGLGLRWRSPVGMVRFDLATPVGDPDRHGVEIHLVIGPDL
ncbi:MAG: autotransporter assembly complex family protein [Tahibacter sp.]